MTVTRALDTGDTDDPACRGGEICPSKSPPRRQFPDLNARPRFDRRSNAGAALSPRVGSSARDIFRHQPNDIGARNFAAQKYADTLSISQDRDPIGQANDFGKTMRHIEHRLSFRSKLHHPFHQQLGVRFRQNRRRLIEDHDFAGMDEGPRDLRQPQMGNAKSGSFGVRVKVCADLGQNAWTVRLSSALKWPRLARPPSPPSRIFLPMENSGTIKISCGTTVIPSRDASLGLVHSDDVSRHEEITLVGGVHAAQDLNERGLARAIFSNQGVDLAAVQIKVHAVERRHAGKTLCDSRSRKANVPGSAGSSHIALLSKQG